MVCFLVVVIYVLVMNVCGIKDLKMIENLLLFIVKFNLFCWDGVFFLYLVFVFQQGVGLVQVWDVVKVMILFSIFGFFFNDIDYFNFV